MAHSVALRGGSPGCEQVIVNLCSQAWRVENSAAFVDIWTDTLKVSSAGRDSQRDVLWIQLHWRVLSWTSFGIANAFKLWKEKSTMTSENNSPDTQKQQEDTNTSETAEKKRISRLANEFAKRGKERQLRYDEGHNIFTK
jgi:hypothetical protein